MNVENIKVESGVILRRTIGADDILNNLEEYQQALSFYRVYPDYLVDLFIRASGPSCTFQLLDYQRIMLRGMARHKDVYYTFSRGTSKSFLNDLWNIICCILYPNSKLAITAGTKGQSGAILESKISEILSLIPAISFEIRKIEKVKDSYCVYFKNNSYLQNLAAKASSRGLRFTGLTIEEIIEADETDLQEVVLPTLAIQRRCANGEFDRNETISQQKIVVTTSGFHGTYAYHSLIRTILRQVTEDNTALALGGSYKIPIIAGLQTMDHIRSQKNSGTLNPTSFAREYLSRWSRGSENAYFPAEIFDRYRSLQEPIFEREATMPKGGGYIFGVDVGRLSDTSEVAIWKYSPHRGTVSTKALVNLVTFEKMHFTDQAIGIKKLFEQFKPEKVVIDGSGLGVGLIDELIKPQADVTTGQYLRPWGVANDDKGYYSQFKAADSVPNILYIVKANAPFNTEMYGNLQTQLTTGKLRFLIDERHAKSHMEASRAKKFKEMSDNEKADWILPFTLTSILRDQMINLEEVREGININLDRSNKSIKKDKVSAMGYGLWYIKTEIDDKYLQQKRASLDGLNATGTKPQRRNIRSKLTSTNRGGYTSNLRKKNK